jgi:hypothetical protein
MKGFIFTNFVEFVEANHGLEMVDEMITSCNLPSEGIYSPFNSYDFDELVSLLTYVSEKTKVNPKILLEQFGIFVFPYLIGKHSYIINHYDCSTLRFLHNFLLLFLLMEDVHTYS